jgi:hypothetical protein
MQRTGFPPMWHMVPQTCSTRARGGDPAVALILRVKDRFVGAAFALDLYAPISRCQRRFALGTGIAAVGVDVAAGVIFDLMLSDKEAGKRDSSSSSCGMAARDYVP